MDGRENEEFTNYLKGAVREAERLKYNPRRFKSMLDADGGFETVKRILASGKPSDGFTRLLELGRLDLTCEAIIVETKWRRYFDEDLLARSEELLRKTGYPFRRFDSATIESEASEDRLAELSSSAPGGDSGSAEPAADNFDSASGGELSSSGADLSDLDRMEISSTTRAALIDARLGQGRFRQELLQRWSEACAVTGCRVGAVLRASHCKPWRESNNFERLDSNNGLILSANLDALFDAGLISFDDEGAMLMASALSEPERAQLGLPAGLRRRPDPKLMEYLGFHRARVFMGL
jgi:hypothetical protein